MKQKQHEQKKKNLGDYYLFVYNVAQFLGWTLILGLLIKHFAEGRPYQEAWDSVGLPLLIFQNAAILEILHPLIGLVRTPIFTTLIQVSSRVFLTSIISLNIPEAREHWAFTTMVASWCLTEIVRYSFYALNIFGACPYVLIWLRYSAFAILYPTGAGSELLLILITIPIARETGMWSISLPNKFNFAFSFYYALILIAISYIPGLPKMYFHMVGQRKRALNPPTDVKKSE